MALVCFRLMRTMTVALVCFSIIIMIIIIVITMMMTIIIIVIIIRWR